MCFATHVSLNEGFVKPEITTSGIKLTPHLPRVLSADSSAAGPIAIKQGRHPIVEKFLEGALFVPNSTFLTDSHSLHIVTGVNSVSGMIGRGRPQKW